MLPRRGHALAMVLAVAGCAAASASGTTGATAPPARVASAEPLLPAGLCFRAGYLHQLPGCESAQAAVVIGVYPTVAAAAKAVAAFPHGQLPLGYPLVEFADSIGLAGAENGVAVVAGFLRDEAAARAWQEKHHELLGGATIMKLVGDSELEASLRKKYGDDHARQHVVVRIQAGGALAYEPRAIEATEDRVHDRDDRGAVTPGQLKPACQLPGDAIFDATVGDLRFYHRWAPVACGGKRAYVRWTQTLMEAVVVAERDGKYRVVQVVDVSCDVATLARWSYDERGRTSTPETVSGSGGCGEDDDEDDDGSE